MKETGAKPIPAFRHKTINDPRDMPDKYSSTPGGTLYSTTPGGTRIIYERNFLMSLKNSPLARSPPNMCYIAGVTNIDPTTAINQINNNNNCFKKSNKADSSTHDDPQFDLDI